LALPTLLAPLLRWAALPAPLLLRVPSRLSPPHV
jgi:hypothetical protein